MTIHSESANIYLGLANQGLSFKDNVKKWADSDALKSVKVDEIPQGSALSAGRITFFTMIALHL